MSAPLEVRLGFVSRFASYLLDRCPSCGLSATTLCARCWYVLNEIGEYESPATRGLYIEGTDPFVKRVLYRWDDRRTRQAAILRDVILSSKVDPLPATIELWAAEFCRRATLDGLMRTKRDWVLVAPPGRSGRGEYDHAGALAGTIAELSGDRLWYETQALEKVGPSKQSKSSKSQKQRSRDERSEIQFQICDYGRPFVEMAKGVIFVDDVLVTGATARAAWVALGRPRAFECWAIASKVRETRFEVESSADS